MQLECACGAAIVGAVLAGRANVAVALFHALPTNRPPLGGLDNPLGCSRAKGGSTQTL